MELKSCYIEGVEKLTHAYGKKEAEALVLRLLEDKYGVRRETLFMEGDKKCDFVRSFRTSVGKIRKGLPLQHITGFQDFLGRRFYVSSSVLIPRQETEELVEMVTRDWEGKKNITVLDIGTGSGVIAITLALNLKGSKVTGVDISRRALAAAKKNANELRADVDFLAMDFLKDKRELEGKRWDVIISNPPYIPLSDRESLPENVKEHDPSRALFVSDNKPLVFYEEIAKYAFSTLKDKGGLYFEINERFADETVEVVKKAGFKDVYIGKDLMEKERFVWSRKR